MSGSDLQKALDFLARLDAAQIDRQALPPRPDYRAVADLALRQGVEISPESCREAFRLTMLARRIALRRQEARGPCD